MPVFLRTTVADVDLIGALEIMPAPKVSQGESSSHYPVLEGFASEPRT